MLIDSLGGSLATGLSISAAFKNHGKVNEHFVGFNASAATIASLGAAHISIDAGAIHLVHQCSMALFSALRSAFGDNEWGNLNSTQFSTLIEDCEKIKAELDKFDHNCVQLYAARCRRSSTKSLRPAKNPEDLFAAFPQLPRDELGRATSAILTDSFTLAADAKWKYIDILPDKPQLTSEAQGELPSQTQLNKLVAVHPGIGAAASAAATYINNTDNVYIVEDMKVYFRVLGTTSGRPKPLLHKTWVRVPPALRPPQ